MKPPARTDVEYLFYQVFSGKPAVFPSGTPFDAQLLRSYILELHPDAHPAVRHRSCLRWEIHGVVFSERLDLKDGRRADGGSVPALEFHGC